jgi:hypothetical protein
VTKEPITFSYPTAMGNFTRGTPPSESQLLALKSYAMQLKSVPMRQPCRGSKSCKCATEYQTTDGGGGEATVRVSNATITVESTALTLPKFTPGSDSDAVQNCGHTALKSWKRKTENRKTTAHEGQRTYRYEREST